MNACGGPLWIVDFDAAIAYDAAIIWRQRRDLGLSTGKPLYLEPEFAHLWRLATRHLKNLEPVCL